jgi:hypothetical protein
MVSLVDGSKPTTPRSWRMGVASCRRPRKASSVSNPTLSTQNDRRKGRKGRKLNFWLPRADGQGFGLQGFASANCQIASGNCGNCGNPPHSGFAMRYPSAGRCVHVVAASPGEGPAVR